MPRIVEHRSALPNSRIVAVHVRKSVNTIPAVFAEVAVEAMGGKVDPGPFRQPLPVEEAYLQALSHAEQAGITVVWIDDPYRLFPPDKRPPVNPQPR